MLPKIDESRLTPAGICEAARAGDVAGADVILAARPELLIVDNPHNWAKTVPGHEIRGAHFRKPIEVAAFFDQPDVVARLLDISRSSPALQGPFDDAPPFSGHFNTLRIALARQHADVVRVVKRDIWSRIAIDAEALERADAEGRTVVHYAAEQGDLSLVRELVVAGAAVDTPQSSGRRLIHSVLDHGSSSDHLNLAQWLVGQGATFDLWVATAVGDVGRVEEILLQDRSQASRNYRPDFGDLTEGFPLVRACASGNQAIVELLLDHGADINAERQIEAPPEFGMPLIAAVYGGHFALANRLIDGGASVDAWPNCAAPLVDMLCQAADSKHAGWLALHELRFVTADPESHLQPCHVHRDEIAQLYERVRSLGATPQVESHIVNQDYGEIERLLRKEIEPGHVGDAQIHSVYRSICHAAAWLGDSTAMNLCMTLRRDSHSAALANDCIGAAINSHNRNGSTESYGRIIEQNLAYLQEVGSEITGNPYFQLATNYLEAYSYGTNPKLPVMSDMVSLANRLVPFKIDIDDRDQRTGQTALAAAVQDGHHDYVEWLLQQGAKIDPGDPPEVNPLWIARKYGFAKILNEMGESTGPWGDVVRSDLVSWDAPDAGQPPVFMCPLNYCQIRVGVTQLDDEFAPKGEVADTHTRFIPFPKAFPVDQLNNVRLIITNRDHPQVVAAASVGWQDGQQGFLLTASNASRKVVHAGACGVSFSWLAVLPTDQPQEDRFEARFGLIPFREYDPAESSFSFQGTTELYADAPLDADVEKFVFLTTTVSGAANAAANNATERGIATATVTVHQTGHRDGGARLHWLVLAPRSGEAAVQAHPGAEYFHADQLWVHAARGEPIDVGSREWQHWWMRFLQPFRERSPCVFMTANRHGVVGHQASAVPMSWHCRSDSCVAKFRSFDERRGQVNVDALAIGHTDVSLEQMRSAHQRGIPTITGWERFLESEWNAYELASSGAIGVNEFGPHGGSLLFHLTYEEHQISTLRRLLALGADVNQQQPDTGARPLHIAAMFGRLAIAQLLIDRGAVVDASTVAHAESDFPPRWKLANQFRPYRGETALHLALYYRHFAVARLLIDAGADPNAEDFQGDRPIDYLPAWHTFPDQVLHWRLINRRTRATADDYRQLLR